MTAKTLLLSALFATAVPVAAYAQMTVEAAVADKSRPADDMALDAERKPAEMLKFIGVKPGMTVVDFMPGGGYFTRLFADVVGPKGKVYAYQPDEYIKNSKDPQKALDRLNGTKAGHDNVETIHDPLMADAPKNAFDAVWTSQNYHDLKNLKGVDTVAFDKLIYASLKPGGVFVILDHAAAAGSGIRDTNTLHRIDPAVVKQELLAAGFVYDGESKVLANPADDHTLKVFDPSLRHRTDQFIYKFRKPKK